MRDRLNLDIIKLPAEILSTLLKKSQPCLSLINQNLKALVERNRLKPDGSFKSRFHKSAALQIADRSVGFGAVDLNRAGNVARLGRTGLG
jgi:hypothetical protein